MLTAFQIAVILAATTVLSAAFVIVVLLRSNKSMPPQPSERPSPVAGPMPRHGPASVASRARMIAMLESAPRER